MTQDRSMHNTIETLDVIAKLSTENSHITQTSILTRLNQLELQG